MTGFRKSLDKKDLEPPFDGLNGKYVTIRTREGFYGGRIDKIKEAMFI